MKPLFTKQLLHAFIALFLACNMIFGMPIAALAQGETQGVHQGEGQGAGQGETQGANQGAQDPSSATDVSASNSNTGPDSSNTNTAATDSEHTTTVNNTSDDATQLAGEAATGSNTNSKNTGNADIETGDANIGVTQVKSDNTAVKNGTVTLSTEARAGGEGDLIIGLSEQLPLAREDGTVQSVQAANTVTGSNSDNTISVSTTTKELTEVQNDGSIDNSVAISANTGENQADKNTGDAAIRTGNANASASLVNLLNTTVENGNIIVSTTDVYGDVQGDIRIPDFNQLADILTGSGNTTVNAKNSNTGADSENTINISLEENNELTVNSTATVDTNINAYAITGQNDSMENTGGGSVATGDASIQASNVAVTNTTVKDASLGVVIVNALNRFIGFLVGSDHVATPLSEDETRSYIDAENSDTGSGSENTIDIAHSTEHATNVANNASITNTIDASAVTGKNTASSNTGKGSITTGNANIAASAVSVANTTVKNGNLAIYIVNIFGNFLGDIFFGDTKLSLPYDTSSKVTVNAENSNTGTNSTNEVNVRVTRSDDMVLNNSSITRAIFNTNLDTGNNRVNKNTNGADITTGTSSLSILSRSVANTAALGSPWGNSDIAFTGTNSDTGESSENQTTLDVTEQSSVTVDNFAIAETFIPGSANTGNNQLDQNTVGGSIITGLIDLSANIGNILNRIFLALNPAHTTIAAEAVNTNTGADSTNENTVLFARNFLLSFFNEAIANAMINLLLNTGGNTANNNTVGAAIATGSICADGSVTNDLNTVDTPAQTTSTAIANNASANSTILALANTGNNETSNNTAGNTAGQQEDCPPSPSPSPTPSPTPPPDTNGNGGGGGNGGNNEQNGQGGGETGDSAGDEGTQESTETVAETSPAPDRRPRIAGAMERIVNGVGGLGLGGSRHRASVAEDAPFPFAPFVAGSMTLITSAAWADRTARSRKHPLPL